MGIILFFFTFSSFSTSLTTDDNEAQFVAYLASEKNNLTLAINKIKSDGITFDAEHVNEHELENKTMLALVVAKISSLEGFLTSQQKELQKHQDDLDKLEQALPSKTSDLANIDRIAKLQTYIDVCKKTIDLIQENLDLAERYKALLLDKQRELDVLQEKHNENIKLARLQDQTLALKQQLSLLYQKNIDDQRMQFTASIDAKTLNFEAEILLNNQEINLAQQKLAQIDIERSIIKADYLLFKNRDIKAYQSVSDSYRRAISQILVIEKNLQKMLTLIVSDDLHLNNKAIKEKFNQFKKQIETQNIQVQSQRTKLESRLDAIQQQLITLLGARQGLSEYNMDTWPKIAHELTLIPLQFYSYLKTLVVKVRDFYVWQDLGQVLIYWLSFSLIIIAYFVLRRLLGSMLHEKERSRMSAHLYDSVLILFYRNLPQFSFFALVWMSLFINKIPYPNYQLLLHLLMVWLVFRTLILISRRALLERVIDASGKDVRLYHRLYWLLLLGGWTTALMVFAQEYPLTILVQDIFYRLFMLFLLTVSLVFWKSQEVIQHVLRPVFLSKVRYVRNASKLLLFLIPFIVFLTALIGLLGYANLAWSMSRYQASLLLILIAYVIARGLVVDALDLISEWMIANLENGWLWTEVFIKPIDHIIRFVLLVTSMIVIFEVFGWASDATVMNFLWTISQYDLLNLSGIRITVLSTIEFAISLSILIWISRWAKEFSYRWLYRDTRDAGLRNSLAVFTQYALILLGGFIALRILGLDLSGMSVVLGGLAVGLGFGLRDFANNIVGGVMLLIERPVREGDLITLGEFEGKVAHIGIRSMRVSTWDNMEVLIPNAETFNKPFTNWTHQDSVIRTVVPIKVSRADCPFKIQRIISEVLDEIPEVLKNPEAQVFLKQIDEALIEFEVRYFMNISTHTRMEIRSKVLFAISARFQREGIHAPIPPVRVEIREGEAYDEFAAIKPCSE